MKGTLTILKADGAVERIDLDRSPTLKELQSAVGGYIQIVPAFERFEGHPCIVICNEEGKLDLLPFNSEATAAWQEIAGPHDDFLVGDVIVCTGDAEFMESL